jgi:hypothetical protein
MLVCPPCGSSTNLDSYDPSEFELEIYETMTDLGRGRGFAIPDEYFILEFFRGSQLVQKFGRELNYGISASKLLEIYRRTVGG